MKKFYLAFIAILSLVYANAQHHKTVAAVLGTSTGIVPGTTMDIDFTLVLINSDREFGDSLAIEFQEGITPVNSPNNPFAPTSFGQAAEAFNGVFGQVVSWGDNNDTLVYGGIETGTYFSFKITVAVDDTVTTRKLVRFFVSGDQQQYNGAPHKDFEGSIFLKLVEPQPNLTLVFNKPVPEYYYVQKNQLPDTLPLIATVTNSGKEITEQAIVSFDASAEGFYDAVQLPRPFKKDTTVTRESNVAFKPKKGKTYNLRVSAETTVDSDLSDNTDSCIFSVTDTVLSRTDDILVDSITLAGTGIIGAVYDFYRTDTISSLSVYLSNPQALDSLRMEIFSMAVGPDTLLGFTTTLIIDSMGGMPGWYTLPLTDTLVMTDTTFFVGVHQLTPDRLSMGITPHNYHPGINFVRSDGFTLFDPAESLGSLYANNYMIRVHTGSPWDLDTTTSSTVGIPVAAIGSNTVIYPNPVSTVVNFSKNLNGKDFTILDLKGAVVKAGILENNYIDVTSLPVGAYLLRVANERFNFVRD